MLHTWRVGRTGAAQQKDRRKPAKISEHNHEKYTVTKIFIVCTRNATEIARCWRLLATYFGDEILMQVIKFVAVDGCLGGAYLARATIPYSQYQNKNDLY
jgi:hypothetical protein